MNRRYRKTIIAGNWKMNKTPAEAKALIEEMKPLLSKTKWCEMVLCVPFTDIQAAVKAAKGSKIAIGAENMHFEKSGAFTGEISADMLKELGVKYVIIGHSERRQYFNETDEACGKKVQVALENGLRPILCVGESLTEREQDVTMEVIRKQIKIALQNVAVEDIKKVVIAYEPIWAIGTGKTATAEQANEVCSAIRDCLRERVRQNVYRYSLFCCVGSARRGGLFNHSCDSFSEVKTDRKGQRYLSLPPSSRLAREDFPLPRSTRFNY